jgi:diketogulonate reductase-like aldo/keto reductase
MQNPRPSHRARPARRSTLKALAGLAFAAAMPGLDALAAGIAPGQLQRKIPRSGEAITAMGLGTWQTFDVAGDSAGLAAVRETLRLFAAAGGRMVDSSPMYGSSESVVGDTAAALGLQSALFFATKVWTSGRDEGIRQMQTSIARVQPGGGAHKHGMDLMQVHNLVDLATHLKTLRAWKAEGRIRHFGFTHYTVDSHRELAALIKREQPDFVQFNYSIATRNAEKALLATAADNQTAVIINRPFEEGDLFRAVKGRPLPAVAAEIGCQSWAQFFLKYILGHPAVTCVIPGTREPRHLLDNMQAGAGGLPDAAMRARMAKAFDSL